MTRIAIIEIETSQGSCFLKDGPECRCGYHQWIIKPNSAVCSKCGKELPGCFTAFTKDGPECQCGYHQWFVSTNQWVCSKCGTER